MAHRLLTRREWTHEALAIDVARSIRSARVIDVLARLVSLHGAPRYLRSDNGPEFVSAAVLAWVSNVGIDSAFIAPGKPWQNGTNESFNGRFRDRWSATRVLNPIDPGESADALVPPALVLPGLNLTGARVPAFCS